LEPVKNKTSFPDFSESGPKENGRQPFSGEGNAAFQLPSFFWDAVATDPAIAAEFNRRVEARALEILSQEGTDSWKAVREASHQEGVQRGLEAGREQLQALCAALETAARVFQAERTALLHQHEALWSEILRHLCGRFLQPLNPERLSNLRDWIEQGVGALDNQAAIQIAVSPTVLAQVQEAAALAQTPGWTWVADPALKDTDLRVELAGGGLLFDAQQEVTQLQNKIDEILGHKTK